MDNALVLAMMVLVLPVEQRRKALVYGIWGAFIFRMLAVIMALVLIKLWWLKILGGLYLFYVAWKGIFNRQKSTHESISHVAFWSVVMQVELLDIAFSIDSILAAVALTEKPLLIITGGVIGIAMMRYAAGIFIKLVEKFQILKKTAYVLVFLIGVKLTLSVWWHPPIWLFFCLLFLVLIGSLVLEKSKLRS